MERPKEGFPTQTARYLKAENPDLFSNAKLIFEKAITERTCLPLLNTRTGEAILGCLTPDSVFLILTLPKSEFLLISHPSEKSGGRFQSGDVRARSFFLLG